MRQCGQSAPSGGGNDGAVGPDGVGGDCSAGAGGGSVTGGGSDGSGCGGGDGDDGDDVAMSADDDRAGAGDDDDDSNMDYIEEEIKNDPPFLYKRNAAQLYSILKSARHPNT